MLNNIFIKNLNKF